MSARAEIFRSLDNGEGANWVDRPRM